MEEVQVDGVVQSVVFQNAENGYTVLRLATPEGETVTAVGCVPYAAPGEGMSLSGVWETHPRHGDQLRIAEAERRLPESRDEIFSFLASGFLPGVGPAMARRIVDRFGEGTLEALEGPPEKLYDIRGITGKRAHEIVAAFRRTMGLRRLMEFLSEFGLPPVLAMRLREQYGDAALDKLRENPYLLAADGGTAFSVADEIALRMGFPPDSDARLQAAVLYELRYNERNGHVFLPEGKLTAATARLLECSVELAEKALDTLIETGQAVREDAAGERACYLRRMWEAERSACARLTLLLSAAPDRSRQADRVIGEIEREQGVDYAPRQREAVRTAAREGVMMLTGGPGTGKTTAVRGIAALFRRMGLRISLCAPTGRAAQRLGELAGTEAQTIHRLLGMGRGGADGQAAFTKSERDPLEADAVIVDEASMVDLPLFSALLRAMRPGTRLVLVGDADQLPSVGPGNVFSDLLRSGRIPAVYLREVFRQAEQSAIIRNAHAVNLGLPPKLSNDQGDFFFLCRRDPVRAADTLVELCRTRLPDNMGIPADQIQVLTPTRKGPCGSERLNRLLQDALNPKAAGKRELLWGERVFREGDRVMQIRNNYDMVWTRPDGTAGTGVFNGDVGRVAEIDPSGQFLVLDFDGRAAGYPLEQLGEIDLAYAVTVHKAQGSEYRCAVFSAQPGPQSLMVRGVLYTALTRARELLVIVGDDAAIRAMAANDRQQRRYSALRWRLAHAGDASKPADAPE